MDDDRGDEEDGGGGGGAITGGEAGGEFSSTKLSPSTLLMLNEGRGRFGGGGCFPSVRPIPVLIATGAEPTEVAIFTISNIKKRDSCRCCCCCE